MTGPGTVSDAGQHATELRLLLLSGALCRFVMANRTADRGTSQAVMMSQMTGCAANDGAFDTALGISRTRCTSEHECENCACQNHLHAGTLH